MSTKEMEAMDDEVMGMVNDHAAPEAMTRADQICEDPAVKPCSCVNHASRREEKDQTEENHDGYWISKEAVDGLEDSLEEYQQKKTTVAVVVCTLIIVALLAVRAKPDLLIWLVNVGVVSCAVVAGIALDRWWRR